MHIIRAGTAIMRREEASDFNVTAQTTDITNDAKDVRPE
jgi:hypothetical protein